MSLTRRDIVTPNNPDMAMYNEYSTPYAFSIVKSQFEKMAERSSYDFERCQTDESYILKCANSSSTKQLWMSFHVKDKTPVLTHYETAVFFYP